MPTHVLTAFLTPFKVGACLGELGVINSADVSFSQEVLHYKKPKNPRQPEEEGEDPREAEAANIPFGSVKLHILGLLNGYLVHPSVKTVRFSSECLSAILNTTSGAEIFKILSSKVQAYLKPFTPRKPTGASSKKKMKEELGSERLWSPQGEEYTSWITNLAHYLAKSVVKDEVFELCAPVCQNIPEFAEFVFPFFLEDILENSKRAHEISLLIDGRLLSEDNRNLESKKIILHAFNYLRSRRIKNLQKEFSEKLAEVLTAQSKAKGGRGRSAKPKIPSLDVSFYLWDSPLWVDLDFVKIVKVL
jgi:hypothetical protein